MATALLPAELLTLEVTSFSSQNNSAPEPSRKEQDMRSSFDSLPPSFSLSQKAGICQSHEVSKATLDPAPFLLCLSADSVPGHASVHGLTPSSVCSARVALVACAAPKLCMFAAHSASLAEPPLDTKLCARHRRGILRCTIDKK